MLVLAAMLAASLAGAPDQPIQLMKGKDFSALLSGVAARCPERETNLRYAFPAKLLDTETEITNALSPHARTRVLRLSAEAQCGNGAGCAAAAGLSALHRAGAMPRVIGAVCVGPEWR